MALILSLTHRLKVSRAGDDEDFGGPLQALGREQTRLKSRSWSSTGGPAEFRPEVGIARNTWQLNFSNRAVQRWQLRAKGLE